MSSSSTSSSDRGLPGWAALVLAGLTVVGIEVAVRLAYRPSGALWPKIEATRAGLSADRPDALILGTCLGDQAIDPGQLDAALGPGGKAHSLSAPGAYPMDWYLTLRHVLDPETVDSIIVVYTPRDLLDGEFSWQTETLDLMDAHSMREVAYWACTEPACVADLYARRTSLLYRNRAYLANQAWTAVGARDGVPPLRAEAAWRTRDPEDRELPWYFVKRIVALAAERHTPLLFLELPANPDHPEQALDARRKDTYDALVAMGVPVVRAPATPGGFQDDVHYTLPGREAVTRALAAAIPGVQRWPR